MASPETAMLIMQAGSNEAGRRWPLHPQDGWHEVVGTLGEVRGNFQGESRSHLHNGGKRTCTFPAARCTIHIDPGIPILIPEYLAYRLDGAC